MAEQDNTQHQQYIEGLRAEVDPLLDVLHVREMLEDLVHVYSKNLAGSELERFHQELDFNDWGLLGVAGLWKQSYRSTYAKSLRENGRYLISGYGLVATGIDRSTGDQSIWIMIGQIGEPIKPSNTDRYSFKRFGMIFGFGPADNSRQELTVSGGLSMNLSLDNFPTAVKSNDIIDIDLTDIPAAQKKIRDTLEAAARKAKLVKLHLYPSEEAATEPGGELLTRGQALRRFVGWSVGTAGALAAIYEVGHDVIPWALGELHDLTQPSPTPPSIPSSTPTEPVK